MEHKGEVVVAWFIGLIVVYLIWRIFFATGTEERLIKKEISNASYISGEMYHVDISYSYFKDFANRRKAHEDYNSISFEMLVDGEKHKVTFFKHERSGFAKNDYTDILVKKV